MARFGEEDYVLGPVRIGLVSAVRKALIIKNADRSWCSRDEAASPTIQEFFRVREQLKLEPK
jgi:hypothetical protein